MECLSIAHTHTLYPEYHNFNTLLAHACILPTSSLTPASSPVSCPPAHLCPHSPLTLLSHACVLPTSPMPTSSPVSTGDLLTLVLVQAGVQQNARLLRVSGLHYLAGSQVLEGFRTAASACALHQPTIAGPSISIVSIHKFRNWGW